MSQVDQTDVMSLSCDVLVHAFVSISFFFFFSFLQS